MAQFLGDVFGCRVAIGRPFLQAAQDNRFELGRYRIVNLTRWTWCAVLDLFGNVLQRPAREGPPARQQLIQDHAQGPDIRSTIELVTSPRICSGAM